MRNSARGLQFLGQCLTLLGHDAARSRAYRWKDDGIAGVSDRHQKICFAIALWNGRDSILKERLFGLTGDEGNHGEDVKECYYYLDPPGRGTCRERAAELRFCADLIADSLSRIRSEFGNNAV